MMLDDEEAIEKVPAYSDCREIQGSRSEEELRFLLRNLVSGGSMLCLPSKQMEEPLTLIIARLVQSGSLEAAGTRCRFATAPQDHSHCE